MRRVIGVGVQHARAARLALLGVAVRVMHEDERDRHAVCSRSCRPPGRVHGDRVGDVLAPLEEVTVDRRRDRHRRRRVADRDHRARGGGLPGRVGDRQPRRVDACGGVDMARVRVGRVDARRLYVEVPGERDRVAWVVVARALARELHRKRRGAVRRRGADRRVRRLRALRVLPPVHAGVGVGVEEAVAVGEQVEVAVGPELHVHRVVALERERRRHQRLTAVQELVDLEDPVLGVEPDLAHGVLRELAEDHRPVVVRRELRLARVGRVEFVRGRPVRADAAGEQLREELRARAERARPVGGEARRAQRRVLVVAVRVPDVRLGDRRGLHAARRAHRVDRRRRCSSATCCPGPWPGCRTRTAAAWSSSGVLVLKFQR